MTNIPTIPPRPKRKVTRKKTITVAASPTANQDIAIVSVEQPSLEHLTKVELAQSVGKTIHSIPLIKHTDIVNQIHLRNEEHVNYLMSDVNATNKALNETKKGRRFWAVVATISLVLNALVIIFTSLR